VTVPTLPGCHTYGATKAEALARAEEAIQGFVETLQKLGRRIHPTDDLNEVQLPVRLPTLA
jgi:antitoxin HicB